jgi:tRNA(fMet)-specific endonuclease VapC
MAPRYLLDTDICIYVRRQRPPQVLERFARLTSGEAALSVVTYGELSYGAAKLRPPPPRAAERLQEFFQVVDVLPLPLEAGRVYGEMRARLEAKGQIIGNNDLWIAAHAMCVDLILVTNNEREFRRVPGLKIENWSK